MSSPNNTIVHPGFINTPRRNIPVDGTDTFLEGRWVALDTDGTAKLPLAVQAARQDLYWVLEGSKVHNGGQDDFGNAGALYASTDYTSPPSNIASKTLTGVYGTYVAHTGYEGIDPEADYEVGDLLTVDAYGRLVAASTNAVYAIAETAYDHTVTSDTGLTFRVIGG